MTFSKFKALSENGFSIIELMVTMGVLLTVGVAGTQLASISSNMNHSVQTTLNATNLSNSVLERMRFSDMCAAALKLNGGVKYTMSWAAADRKTTSQEIVVNIPAIDSSYGITTDVRKDAPIGTLGLKVRSLRLTEPIQVGGVKPDLSRRVLTIVRMGVDRIQNTSGGTALGDLVVGPLLLDVSATNDIIGCKIDQPMSIRDVCIGFGCTYDSTAVPACKCSPQPSVACKPNYFPVGVVNGQVKCMPYGGVCNTNTAGVQQVMTGGGLSLVECGDPPQWRPPVEDVSPPP